MPVKWPATCWPPPLWRPNLDPIWSPHSGYHHFWPPPPPVLCRHPLCHRLHLKLAMHGTQVRLEMDSHQPVPCATNTKMKKKTGNGMVRNIAKCHAIRDLNRHVCMHAWKIYYLYCVILCAATGSHNFGVKGKTETNVNVTAKTKASNHINKPQHVYIIYIYLFDDRRQSTNKLPLSTTHNTQQHTHTHSNSFLRCA